ncbi:MAG: LacI family DNA-binding transcriptional regulator [Opitutaceae bacterium]|nr:LacI family DNA-binding transcriptional regulator [Opitutaceae bacterium]
MNAPATLKEIAKIAGVHHTTVSMALRGKPGISEKTRERIRQIATRLGYTPNPVFSALTRLRLHDHSPASVPKLAFLVNCARGNSGDLPQPYLLMLDGARNEARRLGFSVELVEAGDTELAPHVLTERLTQGEFRGLILVAFTPGHGTVLLDWQRWTAVKIHSQHLATGLPSVCHDHAMAVAVACDRMRRKGFRRIGLVAEREIEDSIGHLCLGGYLLYQHNHPGAGEIPALVLPYSRDVSQIQNLVTNWSERHQVDCILTYSVPVQQVVAHTRRQTTCVSLALSEPSAKGPGVFLHYEALGQRAAALLVSRLRLGSPLRPGESCTSTFVEPTWRRGEQEEALA